MNASLPSADLPEQARRLCADALQLAALQRDGRAWAVLSVPTTLDADPGRAFAAAAGRRRQLMWREEDWLLGIGSAAAITASGPGRTAIAAAEIARLESRCVTAAVAGGPELPVLLGALSFEDLGKGPGHWGSSLPEARFCLPRRLLWRRSAGGWMIHALEVRAGSSDAAQLGERLLAEPEPQPTLPPTPWPALSDDFTTLVEDATVLIRDGAMRKVVLARAVDETVPAGLGPDQAIARLRAIADPQSTLYAIDLDDGGCFVGASPELLFAVKGRKLRTIALAGSSRGDATETENQRLADALFASTKERKEHGVVVEHLVAVLRPRCAPFTVPQAPNLRRLPRMFHLETPIAAELERSTYLELLGALHPTPAVCGLPTATALNYLSRREHLHRGLYAGVLGWCHPGACQFIVPLRGGILRGDRARLFAGAGIVETSDPAAELAETELKLRLMRQVLGQALPQ